ncbi:MAG: Fic family protein [Micrococcales bacterium]|nr:Fic family protein [Micrococcales bacterium]
MGEKAGAGAWESYFYPDTYDPATQEGTLRNLFEERDARVLKRLEYVETAERQRELLAGEASVEATYDAAHVRAVHRHLFGDVYEWAGQYRTVAITKGTPGGFAATDQIDRYLADVHRLACQTAWWALDRDEVAEQAAAVFAYLNHAHPFREGNGRTAKVFMTYLVRQSRFALDFTRVSPQEWNAASRDSGPDLGSYDPVPDSLVPVFARLVVDGPATPLGHVPEQGRQP